MDQIQKLREVWNLGQVGNSYLTWALQVQGSQI